MYSILIPQLMNFLNENLQADFIIHFRIMFHVLIIMCLAISNIVAYVDALPQNPNDYDKITETAVPFGEKLDNDDLVSLNNPSNTDQTRCTSSATTDDSLDGNIDSMHSNIFKRQKTFCPKNIITPVAPKTPRPFENLIKTIPSQNTQNGNAQNPCLDDKIHTQHVTCAGPEVRDSDTGAIDIVVGCRKGNIFVFSSSFKTRF